MSLDLLPDPDPYTLGLTISRDAALVRLAGYINLQAAADLSRLMHSLDLLAYMAVDVDMADVTSLDSTGIRPLVEATRRRRRELLPAVRIGSCSPAARHFLEVSGLDGRPHLNVAAWDRHVVADTAGRPRVSLLAEGHAATVPVPPSPKDGTGTPHNAARQ